MRPTPLTMLLLASALPSLGAGADIRHLDQRCETALALSAAPLHLREDAGVYVLGPEGYSLVSQPGNGFACLVERNHHDSIVPQCFDAGSFDANLAVILDEGKMIRAGHSFSQIRQAREQALESNHYASAGPGVVYMISAFNYVYSHANKALLNVAPHLMFHAPGLSGREVGADLEAALNNRGLPTINAQGPHGFMISFVEKPSDSAEVYAACAGQLPPEDGLIPFPPSR